MIIWNAAGSLKFGLGSLIFGLLKNEYMYLSYKNTNLFLSVFKEVFQKYGFENVKFFSDDWKISEILRRQKLLEHVHVWIPMVLSKHFYLHKKSRSDAK